VKRKTAIVVTTIFEPEFLKGYCQSVRHANRLDETTVYIIPDRKTPPTVAAAAVAARDVGFKVICPALDEQDLFLKRIGAPSDFIPHNTDNRRNVGFLMALEAGCEILISIDDDNFCLDGDDFVGAHHAVGRTAKDPIIRSSDSWFNICSLLDGWDGPAIFPRGFPYAAQKSTRDVSAAVEQKPLHIAMNAGLWLDEPDVDAVFRLCRQPKIQRFSGNSIVLGPDVWSPINTQNTALTREAALTYYYIRMGFPLKGLSIDRFGDILSGYLTQKVIKHLGQGIRVGTPIVEHRRTPHNLFKDLYHELAGIVLVEEFVPWLIELKLTGSNFPDAYITLADAIAAKSDRFQGFIWDDGGRDFLREMSRLMHIWMRVARLF
jgi:hypothetical protein